MSTLKTSPYAAFLSDLERALSGPEQVVEGLPAPLPALLAMPVSHDRMASVVASLGGLLEAYLAVQRAAADNELAADELRRYAKFARPGAPSPHVVQLRQKQGAARLAGSRARQAFVRTATAFARIAGLDVPPRVGVEAFVSGWIETNVPKDAAPQA